MALRAVFVETCCPDVDPELERPRLTEAGWTDTCAAGVVDINEGIFVMRKSDDGFDRLERQQVVCDRAPGQHDEFHRRLGRD